MIKPINTHEDFTVEVLLAEDAPVLVYFWAEWCGPCHNTTSALEEVAKDYGDDVKIVSVEVDKAHELARANQIHALPTFLLCQDGKREEIKAGAMSKSQIVNWLNNHIPGEKV